MIILTTLNTKVISKLKTKWIKSQRSNYKQWKTRIRAQSVIWGWLTPPPAISPPNPRKLLLSTSILNVSHFISLNPVIKFSAFPADVERNSFRENRNVSCDFMKNQALFLESHNLHARGCTVVKCSLRIRGVAGSKPYKVFKFCLYKSVWFSHNSSLVF